MASSASTDSTQNSSWEAEGCIVPQGLLRSWDKNHKFIAGDLVFRISYAPPLAGGPPEAVLYILDPEPELFALMTLHLFGRAGPHSEDATSWLRHVGVVGVAHHPSSAGWKQEELQKLRQRDFVDVPKGNLGRFMDLLSTEIIPHAERHLGCDRPLAPERRALLGCAASSLPALRVLLRRPGVFGSFALGSPPLQDALDIAEPQRETEYSLRAAILPSPSVMFVVGDSEGHRQARQLVDVLHQRGVRVEGLHVLTGEGVHSLRPSLVSRALSWLEAEWQGTELSASQLVGHELETGRSSTTTLPPSPASTASPTVVAPPPSPPPPPKSLPEPAPAAALRSTGSLATPEKMKLLVAFSHPDICSEELPPVPEQRKALQLDSACPQVSATPRPQTMTHPAATVSPVSAQGVGSFAITASQVVYPPAPPMPGHSSQVAVQAKSVVLAGGYAAAPPRAKSFTVQNQALQALPQAASAAAASPPPAVGLPPRVQSFAVSASVAQGSPASAVQTLNLRQARTQSFAMQPPQLQSSSTANPRLHPRTQSFAVAQSVRPASPASGYSRTQSFMHQQVQNGPVQAAHGLVQMQSFALNPASPHGAMQQATAVQPGMSFSAADESTARLDAMRRAVIDATAGAGVHRLPMPRPPAWHAVAQPYG